MLYLNKSQDQTDTKQNPSKTLPLLSYYSLSVGDVNANDLLQISDNAEIAFEDVTLHLTRQGKNFDVQRANIAGVTYLKTVKKYQVREFEKLFGFSSACEDFVLGKVIVVRDNSY